MTKRAQAGSVFIAIALIFGVYSNVTLDAGTAGSMGPGYFPNSLAILLAILGAAAILAAPKNKVAVPSDWISVKSFSLIVASPILFAALLIGAGLVPAVMAVVLMTSYASRRTTLTKALLLAVGLSVFCSLVFVHGLKLPVPLFGSWFEI